MTSRTYNLYAEYDIADMKKNADELTRNVKYGKESDPFPKSVFTQTCHLVIQ